MKTKFSEIKLLLSFVLFIAALGCMLYNVFYNSATNTKMFFVVVSLALARISVVMLKQAKQAIK